MIHVRPLRGPGLVGTDPESSLTLSWISKTLRIPPATVTDIIDRLEDDRLVRRVPHPSDARTTLAVITAKGRKAATDATQDLNATVYERNRPDRACSEASSSSSWPNSGRTGTSSTSSIRRT